MRPDTFHGLVLIVIFCIVFSPILLPAFMLVCAIGIVWILVGCVFLTCRYFYRGFRYGKWMEA